MVILHYILQITVDELTEVRNIVCGFKFVIDYQILALEILNDILYIRNSEILPYKCVYMAVDTLRLFTL